MPGIKNDDYKNLALKYMVLFIEKNSLYTFANIADAIGENSEHVQNIAAGIKGFVHRESELKLTTLFSIALMSINNFNELLYQRLS